MKIVVTSDLHLDHRTGGFERFGEIKVALEQTVECALDVHADAWAFLGDLTDPDLDEGLTHRAIALAVQTDGRLREEGLAPWWLVGNHDVIEDGRLSHTLLALAGAGAKVFDRPDFFQRDDVGVIALPYAALAYRYDPAAYVRSVTEKHGDLRQWFVMGHMTRVDGVDDGSETVDMARGGDMRFPIEEAQKLPRAVLVNGHYHRQRIARHVGDVNIPGSLARLTHGEEQNEPGFLIVEV